MPSAQTRLDTIKLLEGTGQEHDPEIINEVAKMLRELKKTKKRLAEMSPEEVEAYLAERRLLLHGVEVEI